MRSVGENLRTAFFCGVFPAFSRTRCRFEILPFHGTKYLERKLRTLEFTPVKMDRPYITSVCPESESENSNDEHWKKTILFYVAFFDTNDDQCVFAPACYIDMKLNCISCLCDVCEESVEKCQIFN